jgi:O-acetyl-ADP-ribose deacetylase (regulator of RNase III)
VIHTVGPVWHGGKSNEAELLRNCYLNSLKLAEEYHLKTIAFPAISTGAYGYSIEESAKIAIKAVRDYLKNSKIEKVILVLFSDRDRQVYERTMKQVYG